MWWVLPFQPIINQAGVAEADALSVLHEEAFALPWSADDLAALLRDDAVMALAARRSGLLSSSQPIGFILLRAVVDEAEILTIAVTRRYRRRGIGRLLVEAALRRLYADGVRAIFLEVDTTNRAAVSLYRRIGFDVVGERGGYYRFSEGDGTALVMRYDLR